MRRHPILVGSVSHVEVLAILSHHIFPLFFSFLTALIRCPESWLWWLVLLIYLHVGVFVGSPGLGLSSCYGLRDDERGRMDWVDGPVAWSAVSIILEESKGFSFLRPLEFEFGTGTASVTCSNPFFRARLRTRIDGS